MKVLRSSIKSSFTIKKSKFLCLGFFIKSKEDVKVLINKLKKEYPDASHICYSYILDEKTFYFTDGGEPSGTAGKPIYSALQKFKLNYTLFVVIRYFGGIKFGPGPLRSTFKDVAIQTLSAALLKDAILTDIIQIHIPYSKSKIILSKLKPYITQQQYKKEFIVVDLAGKKEQVLTILNNIDIQPIVVKENQVV